MTHTPPSEAAASSPSTRDPWNEATPDRLDQAARALTYNGSQAEGAAKHLLFVAGHRIESLLRQREQLHGDLLACAIAIDSSAEFLGGRSYVEFVRPNVPEGVRKLRDDRDAWKHKADTLGGDLNRIRSLVPTASDEQSTFDAVQAELAKVRKERDASSKALFDAAIALEEFDGAHGTSENLAPRIRALLAERQRLRDLAERNGKAATERADLLARCGRAVGAKMDDDVPVAIMGRIPAEVERVVAQLRAEVATAKDDVKRLRAEKREEIATAVDHLRRAGIIVGSPTAGPTDGVAIGMTLASVVGMLCDERAKILAERDARASLSAEAQTAIAAMRDVGPELAKAGIHVGQRCSGLVPPLSHAEAVAQLRGERDQWREKFEMADREAANAARWGISTGEKLTAAGFALHAPKEAGLHCAVLEALAELTRLRKELKRDQVAKQQALLDEIARLFPGKGPLLKRVKHAAKVDEPQLGLATTKQLLEELQARAEVGGYASYRTVGGEVPNWLDAMRRTEPKRDVSLAPIRGLVDEAVRSLFERRSCKEAKVGPATGQPRTKVPLNADGSGKVLNLGEAFRVAMGKADPSSELKWGDAGQFESHLDARLRFLHTAVAELAKVVERIGAW